MTENIKKLQELLNCELISIDSETSLEMLMENYLSLLKQGKVEGFVPVIVTADDIFIEKLELDLEDEDLPFSSEGMKIYREKILAEASGMYGQNIYEEEKKEMKDAIDRDQIEWEVPEDEELLFTSCVDFDGDDAYDIKENVVIVKLPTDKPYEVFAWLPMGGFNDCPLPAKMVAVAKYWYEKHGAEPSAITYDTAEFYLPKPTDDKETVMELAIEQYVFDTDIVEQGVGDVESLIETLYLNKQWYFWWD